eukprot:COSAG01_NODE_16410_length_1238_cov_1.679543_1_plen_258_part_10
MDVFCRETLAGDWLEVIGLWQPGDARTGDSNRRYTPHPDFWVAALWRRLMDVRVLGANATIAPSTVGVRARAPLEEEEEEEEGGGAEGRRKEGVARGGGSTPDDERWLIVHGQSSDWSAHGNPQGTPGAPLYGVNISSWQACQALCEAHQRGTFKTKPCRSWSWCDKGCGGQWALRCFGRLDGTWSLHPVAAVTSGCDQSLSKCTPPPPPPPPPPVARVFARECIVSASLPPPPSHCPLHQHLHSCMNDESSVGGGGG